MWLGIVLRTLFQESSTSRSNRRDHPKSFMHGQFTVAYRNDQHGESYTAFCPVHTRLPFRCWRDTRTNQPDEETVKLRLMHWCNLSTNWPVQSDDDDNTLQLARFGHLGGLPFSLPISRHGLQEGGQGGGLVYFICLLYPLHHVDHFSHRCQKIDTLTCFFVAVAWETAAVLCARRWVRIAEAHGRSGGHIQRCPAVI